MCALCAASSSASRRCTAAYAASSYSPRPIPDWFVTITTNQPVWFSRRIAAAAPGSRRTFPGSCRKPGGGSSTIVPSRSRNTARCLPSGIQGGADRAGDLLDLVGEDGPRVEDDVVVGDANNDGRVRRSEPRGYAVGSQLVSRQRDEPRLELRSRERSAADFRFSLDYVRTFAHAFVQRFCASTYLRDVFGQHPEYRYFTPGDLRIAIERQRRFERGQGELIGPDCPGERIGAASVDRRLRAEQDPGLRATEQLVAGEDDRVDAARQRLADAWLSRKPPSGEVEQQAAAQIEQARDPGAARHGGDVARGHFAREARHPEVGAVHLEEQARRAAEVRVQHHAGRVDHRAERRRGEAPYLREHRPAPPLRRRRPAVGARDVDRLPHGAQHETAGVSREQRRHVGLGEQRLYGGQPAARVGHGDFEVSRGARVVSRAAGFGTGTVSTPCASAAAPFRLVAPWKRIRYFEPGVSGRAACRTTRSKGTGRCLSSWRTFVVSAAAARGAASPGSAGARRAAAGGRAAPARTVSRRAVVSFARRTESALARAFACSESYCAVVNSARTATGVVSGSAYSRTCAASSGRRGSSGAVNWMRQASESTASTPRMRGPTVSWANTHSTALPDESIATVVESNGSRRSSWRLLFWSWIAQTR